NAALEHVHGADAALQLANDVGEDHVAPEPDPCPLHRLHRRHVGGVGGFHVGDADAVDALALDLAAERVPGPALARRIGIEMAVEHEAPAPAASAPSADAVEAAWLDFLQLGLEPERGVVRLHEPGDRSLLAPGRVASDAVHLLGRRYGR